MNSTNPRPSGPLCLWQCFFEENWIVSIPCSWIESLWQYVLILKWDRSDRGAAGSAIQSFIGASIPVSHNSIKVPARWNCNLPSCKVLMDFQDWDELKYPFLKVMILLMVVVLVMMRSMRFFSERWRRNPIWQSTLQCKLWDVVRIMVMTKLMAVFVMLARMTMMVTF